MQASLLSHAIHTSGATQGELRVSGQTADGQHDEQKQQNMPPGKEAAISFRRKRQLDQRGHTHLSHSSLPGSISVKGFPNTFIPSDRSRRHLVHSANKKKSKRKSRVGSFSLLSNDKKANLLQVIRAKRQVKTEPAKRNSLDRTGSLSVLGDPQNNGENDRPKRNVWKRSAAKE
ncbi:uncharacterized protein si:dkey-12l12.1 [Brachionichthys hirsutus]|uniref:uncharacterized protein si:dkey-12l12.1 n=1 Tax=Brachionichthys hirsutus TaxID=412623 RepID=UPI0036044710